MTHGIRWLAPFLVLSWCVEVRMQSWELLAQVTTPDGSAMTLMRRGQEYLIQADGKDLMLSRMHGSEEELARLACARAAQREEPWVLVGGLGMGFTLRAALDQLPAGATVVVAELLPAVVDWNRGPLGPLAGRPLGDRRVRVEVSDVADILAANPGRFDAVLLDVDNGPRACAQSTNVRLYGNAGVELARAALKPGGTLAVWSAWGDAKFEQRLRHCGFQTESRQVRARLKKGGAHHTIFLGLLPEPGP
jgi:spermidine synthase